MKTLLSFFVFSFSFIALGQSEKPSTPCRLQKFQCDLAPKIKFDTSKVISKKVITASVVRKNHMGVLAATTKETPEEAFKRFSSDVPKDRPFGSSYPFPRPEVSGKGYSCHLDLVGHDVTSSVNARMFHLSMKETCEETSYAKLSNEAILNGICYQALNCLENAQSVEEVIAMKKVVKEVCGEGEQNLVNASEKPEANNSSLSKEKATSSGSKSSSASTKQ